MLAMCRDLLPLDKCPLLFYLLLSNLALIYIHLFGFFNGVLNSTVYL